MTNKKCGHGKQKSRCRECKGVGICSHGRVRYQCKDCGGADICKHLRFRHRCRECEGSSLCEHKRRSECSICSPTTLYRHYKYGAKHRGLTFSITLEEFKALTARNCDYCGLSPVQANGMGIDRVDSSMGYEVHNCVASCSVDNRAKMSRTRIEYLTHCRRVALNNPQ